MSTTEWKFVPVEPTREMLVAALKTNGVCPIYAAMLDAAPVPPSVESLLENWTPADQQAFAKFRDQHFPGEMSSYAIQSLGSAWKDGQVNASTEVQQYTGTGTGSDSLDCILGVGGFASFGPLDAQPAHLTIPGALEWDGDNGTHGVVDTHSADGAHSESAAAIATLKALGYTHNGGTHWKPPVGQKPDFDLIDSLRAQLEKQRAALKFYADRDHYSTDDGFNWDSCSGEPANILWHESEPWFIEDGSIAREALSDSAEPAPIAWHIGGNGYDEVAFSYPVWALDLDGERPAINAINEVSTLADLFRRGSTVSAARAEPAKPKTCIECDQPYCHGVCVERGDQDYDRDQAAKGGDDA